MIIWRYRWRNLWFFAENNKSCTNPIKNACCRKNDEKNAQCIFSVLYLWRQFLGNFFSELLVQALRTYFNIMPLIINYICMQSSSQVGELFNWCSISSINTNTVDTSTLIIIASILLWENSSPDPLFWSQCLILMATILKYAFYKHTAIHFLSIGKKVFLRYNNFF